MHPNIISHGEIKPLHKPVLLTAGDLTVQYENGFLRYIKMGNEEIVRMINHAVRDSNWETVPLLITSEKIENKGNNFIISYEACCQKADIDFAWQCSIVGRENNSISFEIVGTAKSAFKRNRIGFTLIHPIENCVGKNCLITHSDDKNETAQFPKYISANQPFLDVSAMIWQPNEQTTATVRFEGDIFETEDQRNWIDASFKTYCTPLSKPFPVLVEKNEIIKQSIHLKIETLGEQVADTKQPISFTIDNNVRYPFPKIGLQISTLTHNENTLDKLKLLGVDFVRIELVLDEKVDFSALKKAHEITSKINTSIELVLFFGENYDTDFVQYLIPFVEDICQIIVLSIKEKCTDPTLINKIVPILREHFPLCQIGAGTDAFFAELNRSRTPTSQIDFLTFSVNPQVHAFDIKSMTETLKAHQYVVETCRQFAMGKLIHVGPVTFKMRWNPNATYNKTELSPSGQLPSNVDSRQLSLYGAAWLLGSFKYLTESQVCSITFFETCGWGGLIHNQNEPWPLEFGVPEKCVYPIYLLLKKILNHKLSSVVPFNSSAPLFVDGVAFVNELGNETIILANFTNKEQRLKLDPKIKINNFKSIDNNNLEKLITEEYTILQQEKSNVTNEILLKPFAIVFSD